MPALITPDVGLQDSFLAAMAEFADEGRGGDGSGIGRDLAERGITVLFMTANPEQLGNGVPGTLGVLTKPVADAELRQAIRFAVSRREKERHAPPRSLQLFDSAA